MKGSMLIDYTSEVWKLIECPHVLLHLNGQICIE